MEDKDRSGSFSSLCLHIKALLTEFVWLAFLIQMFVFSSLLSEPVQQCSVTCNEGIAKLNKFLDHMKITGQVADYDLI